MTYGHLRRRIPVNRFSAGFWFTGHAPPPSPKIFNQNTRALFMAAKEVLETRRRRRIPIRFSGYNRETYNFTRAKPSDRPPGYITVFLRYLHHIYIYKYKNSFSLSLSLVPRRGPAPYGELSRQSFLWNLPERRGNGGPEGVEILEKLKIVFAPRSLPRGPRPLTKRKKKITLFRNNIPYARASFPILFPT